MTAKMSLFKKPASPSLEKRIPFMKGKPMALSTPAEIKRAKKSVKEILANPVIAAQMEKQSKESGNYVFSIAYKFDAVQGNMTNGSLTLEILHNNGHPAATAEKATIVCPNFANNKNMIFKDGGTVGVISGKPAKQQDGHGAKIAQGLKTLAYIVGIERAQTGFAASRQDLKITTP